MAVSIYAGYVGAAECIRLDTLKDPQGSAIPAWKVIWPVFGATNQLLAGLVLLVVGVWLRRTGKKVGFVLGPMVFMNVMTVWALILLLKQYRLSVVGVIAGVLLLLALVLIFESYRTFAGPGRLLRSGCEGRIRERDTT